MVLITVMLRMVTQKSHRPKATEEGMHRKEQGEVSCQIIYWQREFCLCPERASQVRACPSETWIPLLSLFPCPWPPPPWLPGRDLDSFLEWSGLFCPGLILRRAIPNMQHFSSNL